MVITALLAATSFLQVGGSVSDNALLDGEKAYMFLQPVPVAEGRWVCSQWSDDGQYLIVVSEQSTIPPTAYREYFETGKQTTTLTEFKVSTFSIRTGRARELWSGTTRPRSAGSCSFFRGSDVAIVALTGPDSATTVLRVTPSTSKVEVVETLTGEPEITIHKNKLAAVSVNQPPSVRFVPPSGNVYRRQPLSKPGGIAFRTDGVAVLSRATASGKHLTVLPGGGEEWVDGLPDYGPGFDENFETSRVVSHQTKIAVPGGPEVQLVLASIRDGKESIVVAADAQAIYSENDLGMLYVMGETMSFVRPIVQISKEAYQKRLDAEQRAEIMRKLVEIGRALQMYASGHKNTFPTKDQLEAGALDPYSADPISGTRPTNLLNGFVYHGVTVRGSSPANTEAGFMLCPGGRAVLYQDGHVAFVPNRN